MNYRKKIICLKYLQSISDTSLMRRSKSHIDGTRITCEGGLYGDLFVYYPHHKTVFFDINTFIHISGIFGLNSKEFNEVFIDFYEDLFNKSYGKSVNRFKTINMGRGSVI